MVGTDGSSMLEVCYRFYDNRTITVFKSIKNYPPIVDVTVCPKLYVNSGLDSVLKLIHLCMFTFRYIHFQISFTKGFYLSLKLIVKTNDWNAVLYYCFDNNDSCLFFFSSGRKH